MEKFFLYIESKKEDHLNELKEFLSIPSISSQSDYDNNTRNCAQWVAEHMALIGLQNIGLFETPRHPVVYGEWLGAPGKPTILIYGHYDVQPPDPLNLWTSPPFKPVIRGDNLYARGAVDDKGQIFIHFKSIECYMRTCGALPLNVKMLIEGEEEIASKNLEDFTREHKDILKADFALISDSSMFRKGMPSVCFGLRGIAYMEIELTGPNHDLHSGSFGGAVQNPVHALCKIIASLHDEDGKVTIPGFYHDVLPISEQEQKEFNRLPHNDEEFAKGIGIRSLYGEKGYNTLERIWIRPTLELNGIWGGYTGEGEKTIIPSKAYAKISMRLVPNQRYREIAGLFTKYIKAIAPKTVDIKVKTLSGCEPTITRIDTPAVKAISNALEKAFGVKPLFQREGGSIPVVAHLKSVLNLDSVLVGFGLPDANAHAPDEHININNIYSGIKTLVYFYKELSGYY